MLYPQKRLVLTCIVNPFDDAWKVLPAIYSAKKGIIPSLLIRPYGASPDWLFLQAQSNPRLSNFSARSVAIEAAAKIMLQLGTWARPTHPINFKLPEGWSEPISVSPAFGLFRDGEAEAIIKIPARMVPELGEPYKRCVIGHVMIYCRS